MTETHYNSAPSESPNAQQGGPQQPGVASYGQPSGQYGYGQPGGQQSYSGYTQSQDGTYTAGYQQPQGYQQSPYQQAYQQPVGPAVPVALYPMTETDRNLRLVAFIFAVLTTVGCGMLIIPLAWMIPLCVINWGIYKGQKPNTVAFGVCMLLFCNLVSGILLLCSHKDR